MLTVTHSTSSNHLLTLSHRINPKVSLHTLPFVNFLYLKSYKFYDSVCYPSPINVSVPVLRFVSLAIVPYLLLALAIFPQLDCPITIQNPISPLLPALYTPFLSFLPFVLFSFHLPPPSIDYFSRESGLSVSGRCLHLIDAIS